MSRIINGALSVPSFDATAVSGEYTITGATFLNVTDATGNGAGDVQVGFVLYVPATDPNTATPISGVAHRYKVTAVNPIDASTLDLTVLWDEDGNEEDAPTNGVDCLLTETTPNKNYGYIVDTALYPSIASFIIPAAINSDVYNIDDVTPVGSATSYLHLQEVDDNVWTVFHHKTNLNYSCQVYDESGDQTWPDHIVTVDADTVQIEFLAPMQGKAVFVFV